MIALMATSRQVSDAFTESFATTLDLVAEHLPCKFIRYGPECDEYDEWWEITAKCFGESQVIVDAYEEFTKEFVKAVPTDHRDFIRIELIC